MALTDAEIDAALAAAGIDAPLPPELRTTWVRLYNENDLDGNVATILMRQDPVYDTYYPGNKTAEGRARYTEAEYEAIVDAFENTLIEYNLPPDMFSRTEFGDMIAGLVSPSEFNRRVAGVVEGVTQRGEDVRQFYATNYGVPLTDDDIIKSVLQPGMGDQIIQERIQIAQIGGAAAGSGFDIELDVANSLQDIGVSYDQALQLFQTAESQIPVLQRLVQRHDDPNNPFDLNEFLDAAARGDAETISRIQNLTRAETAGFTETGFGQDRQTGVVGGLVDR
jgi:hypothetical protein